MDMPSTLEINDVLCTCLAVIFVYFIHEYFLLFEQKLWTMNISHDPIVNTGFLEFVVILATARA